MRRYLKLAHEPGRFSRWVRPHRTEFRLACCDCGLIHDMKFRVWSGKIMFAMRRNARATAARRRNKKFR
jgi:hypothetical protein